MKCSVCDGALRKGWNYCPDCGYDVRLSEPEQLIDASQVCFEPPVGVRATVFEVVVRHAMSGAAWREICAGAMKYNNITDEEIEAEVRRRQDGPAPEVPRRPAPRKPETKHTMRKSKMPAKQERALTPVERLSTIKSLLQKLNNSADAQAPEYRENIEQALHDLERVIKAVESQDRLLDDVEREAKLQRDLDRELRRTENPLGSSDPGRHYFT